MPAQLPPFSSLIKGREVEDPVNVWFNRPLAYAFTALVYRTPITPNQVTLISMVVGIASAFCWIAGSPSMMVLGGVLLWTSAIFNGADGILARAKNMQSPMGRALDGAADLVVALFTVGAAFYRIWVQRHEPFDLILMAAALGTSILHTSLYDFYRESYLYFTNPKWDGKPERIQQAQQRLDDLKRTGGHFSQILASILYMSEIKGQTKFIARTNPAGSREHLYFAVNDETIDLYRKHNLSPMRLWTVISTAPHSYLMAIAGMFDYIYLYLLFRVFVANAFFIALLIWQRVVSSRYLRDLEARGLSPKPAD